MKIGIIGSDNSHAKVFAKALNVERHKEYSDIRITHIWGEDPAETQDKVEHGNIPNIAEKPTDMIGQVDAALLVLRHGGLHREHALPFIEAKIPLFIDKPLACSPADARTILAATEKYKVPLTSFSVVRYDSAIQKLKANLKEFGEITTGDVAGVISAASAQYGGMIFYGIHTTELMLELFGYGVTGIFAEEINDTTVATVCYGDQKIVTMHFMGKSSYLFSATIHGEKKSAHQTADAGDHYPQGLKRFINLFRTGKQELTSEQLFEPVAIHDAITRSLKSGKMEEVERY